MQPGDRSGIISLAARRKENNRVSTQSSKTQALRLLELEADVSRLVDIVYEQGEWMEEQDRKMRKILELLEKSRASKG